MNQKVLLTIAIVLTLGALYIYQPKVQESFGSVSRGSEYHSTTTRTGTTGLALTDLTNLCPSGGGTLGSVVITGAGTGVFNLYDGTTTIHTDRGTTTLASFPASAAAGTYTFDSIATMGLIYDIETGSVATSTITYKCN